MEKICPICEARNSASDIISKVTKVWQDDKNVYLCKVCNLYFIDTPSIDEIEGLYKHEYHSVIRNKLFTFAKSKMRYARSISQYNYINTFYGGKPFDKIFESVAEVGAYDGLLLSMFKNNSNVYGYEANDLARDYAQKKYHINMASDFFLDSNNMSRKYNLIILSHVLEHFKNPYQALLDISSTLNKDGGILYIEVPRSPMPSECSEGVLQRYLNTTHTVNFNVENISILIKKCNLHIQNISYSNYNTQDLATKINLLEGSIPSIFSIQKYLSFAICSITRPRGCFIHYKIGEPWQYAENICLIAHCK